MQAFKASAIAAIREYFDSSDAAEVGRSLGDLEEPGLTNIFVKQVRLPLLRGAPPPWDETHVVTGHGWSVQHTLQGNVSAGSACPMSS